MTNQEILQSDLLDILFENRNKAYGAYTLRRNYNQRLGLGLGCALSIVFLLLLVNSFSFKNRNEIIENAAGDSVIVTQYKEDPPKPKNSQPKSVKQVKNPSIKIVPQEEVSQPEVPTQDQLSDAVISSKNIEGIPSTGSEKSLIDNNPGTVIDQRPHENIKPFISSEIPASYPGGPKAFSEFLSRNLYPPSELEAGDKKTVLVQFLVDVDGSISKIEIIQSGGKNFDNEVMRVLRKMPKWNPAEQNGHKVIIAFSQPVTFVGIEQ